MVHNTTKPTAQFEILGLVVFILNPPLALLALPPLRPLLCVTGTWLPPQHHPCATSVQPYTSPGAQPRFFFIFVFFHINNALHLVGIEIFLIKIVCMLMTLVFVLSCLETLCLGPRHHAVGKSKLPVKKSSQKAHMEKD